MGVAFYILAYLAVGYLIALLTAAIAPPSEGERIDVMTLAVTFGWGPIAVVLIWRVLCVPVMLIRRARLRMAGQVTTNE